MVKYFLGVLSGVLLVFFLGVLVIVVILMSSGPRQEPIAQDSVLEITLRGGLPEHVSSEFSLDFIQQRQPTTLISLRRTLERAAEDDRIRAVALYPEGLGVGFGKLQELRWAIEEFRKSGKPVYAYLQVAGTVGYLAAAAGDEVYLAPEGLLDMKGLRSEVSFYKDTLEKMGVEVEMERVGRYKSAAEPYSRSEMSDEFREVTNAVLDGLYGQLTAAIAESRGMSEEEVRAAIDQGPFLPSAARDLGLVDDLLYRDEFETRIREALGTDEYRKVGLARYRGERAQTLGLGGGDGRRKVAVVYGVGAILRGTSESDPFFGSQVLGAETLVEALETVREDESIEAVVLRVDSPGGDAIASDEMWRGLQLLADEKPVVVSMSDVAASGGYYMAMADGVPILAYPGTFTGSIGVYFGKINLSKLYEKIGLNKEILTRGRFAAIDTDYRGLEPEERDKLREGVESVYQAFVRKAAEARGMTYEELDDVAQGRVWLGSQAMEVGLVDELGGFEAAIDRVKAQAGIAPDEEVALVTFPKPKSLLEMLLSRPGMAGALGIERPALPQGLTRRVDPAGALPALLEGGFLALSPYAIEVR